MPILELCAGYGGLGMAVEALTGDRLAYVAEVDEAACRVLAARFPDVPNIGDITVYDWAQLVGLVSIVTAGFPCQDISNAGKREGIDGARSGVYRNVVEAVRVIRPRLVFLENVSAIRSRGLWQVAADLAAIGYDARWTCLRASEVGAPHPRDRWFLVAYPADAGSPRLEVGGFVHARQELQAAERGGTSPAAWWGDFLPAVRRWEELTGRPAPEPTEPGPGSWRQETAQFPEWMMGLPDGWITDVPGVSRNDAIRLAGNGVVPQQAHAAFAWLLSHESPAEERA